MGTTIRRGARCKRGLQSPGREFESPSCLSSGWASHYLCPNRMPDSDAISQPLICQYYLSGQQASAVNRVALSFGGSNPSAGTRLKETLCQEETRQALQVRDRARVEEKVVVRNHNNVLKFMAKIKGCDVFYVR